MNAAEKAFWWKRFLAAGTVIRCTDGELFTCALYQLYGKRTAPAAALRQAQLATIAELRSKRGKAEPALWAPFIVQGW